MPGKLPRILLTTPHMGDRELQYINEAFETNWIAPLGPHIDAFEKEFATYVGAGGAAALNSGTSALHLALILAGVVAGDQVVCSDLTFIGGVTPILWQGAQPVFIDSETETWNLDPNLLDEALTDLDKKGNRPKAVVVTHLYGLAAKLDEILEVCRRHEVKLIEDAAEAVGVRYKDKHTGTFGETGIFSFNGNKILTTSGGGMLVSDDAEIIERAKFLATQARDPAPHYEHTTTGFNYRLSNVLAGIGRGQLEVIEDRVQSRRAIFEYYRKTLSTLPGVHPMPSPPDSRNTHWLSCILIDESEFGESREGLRTFLDREKNIEARPVWKPMHLQPVFEGAQCYGGKVSADLFKRGLCLPSGSSMSQEQLQRVSDAITEFHQSRVAG